MLLAGVAMLVAAVFFLRNAYMHSSNSPVAEAATPVYASTSVPPPDTPHAEIPSSQGSAYEFVPKNRSSLEEEIITRAKDAPASMLDSTLPHQSVGYWIAHAAGPYARLAWEVNSCATPHKQDDSSPVCAQANLEFSNGTKFQLLVLLGDQPLNAAGPVKYSQPSLLWAFYQKRRGALTPAPLGLLQRIAQENQQ
jgi:hypothetical protein